MTTATSRTFSVPDISCDHCVNAITEHLNPIEGVTNVIVDLEAKAVTVDGGDDASILAAIDEAGYDVA